jgi:DNA-binding NarL/FixJ family response regulator
MNTGVRHSLQSTSDSLPPSTQAITARLTAGTEVLTAALPIAEKEPFMTPARVRIGSENGTFHEALTHLLTRNPQLEILAQDSSAEFGAASLVAGAPDILLLTSSGNLDRDVSLIRQVRILAPAVHIVIFGGLGDEWEFIQYVRAGVRGYLLPDATGEDVSTALQMVHSGRAFCPSTLCAVLFKYFEREATSIPSAALQQRLNLTRREQQLIPLIARGLTNREIANHFCLSEQTVKNHLYRMKNKIGAENRLGIVQTCYTQGFLL